MNKKRLLKLARFLEKLPTSVFDLSYIVNGQCDQLQMLVDTKFKDKKVIHKCKSMACAVGWMPAVFPELCMWSNGTVTDCDDLVSRNDMSLAKHIFDMNFDQLSYLFDTTYFAGNKEYTRNISKETPKVVAKRIRNFVKDGKYEV